MKAEELLRDDFERGIKYPATVTEIAVFAERYANMQLEKQQTVLHNLYTKPTEVFKQFEDWYRAENPRKDGGFYLPDSTLFYSWITEKLKLTQSSQNNENLSIADVSQQRELLIGYDKYYDKEGLHYKLSTPEKRVDGYLANL